MLKVQLLGPARFFWKKKELSFPFRKVQALACYLMVERRVSREILADLFWGDRTDVMAARNLRNALYELRKQLPPGLIEADRQWVFLGDVEVDMDLDNLTRPEGDLGKGLSPQGCLFMEGFTLADCPAFEEWLRENRSRFKQLCRDYLRDRVADMSEEGCFQEALPHLNALLSDDDLDEEVYRLIMTCYSGLGRRGKVAETYDRLRARFAEDLGISPSPETEALVQTLLSSGKAPKPLKDKGTDSFSPSPFFGRNEELARIEDFCEAETKHPLCVLVSGEAGVGKSLLLSKFLDALPEGALVLSCKAAQGEGRYPLLPWNDLLGELSSAVDPGSLGFPETLLSLLGESFPSLGGGMTSAEPASTTRIGRVLADLFRLISRERRVYLLMEDLQWFDDASLEILESFLLHRPGGVILLFSARPDVSCQGESMIRSLFRAGRIELCGVELGCFSLTDMEGFCRGYLPERVFTQEEREQLFVQTEGLPLFLAELLQLIGSGRSTDGGPGSLAEAIEGVLAGIDVEERVLLEDLSVFLGRADWELLRDFSGFPESRLAEMTDRLCGLSILVERVEAERKLFIEFSHVRVKEHVLSSMSAIRRRLLHRRLAERLMAHLDRGGWNDLICSRIVGHCREADMKIEELDYTIRKLRLHIRFHYELFPLFNDRVLRNVSSAFEGRSHTQKQLREVRSLIAKIREDLGDSERLNDMEMTYRAILGGYLLWWGEYDEGEKFVRTVLDRALIVGDADLESECLQHLCYYGIQIEDGVLLESHARRLMEVSVKRQDGPAQAMCFRFLGLAHLFRQNFLSAERALKASIGRFEELEILGEPFTFQKAAAFNYLGSISHRAGHFREAIEIYEECLRRCEDEGIFRGGCLFHSNAAHTAYDMGDRALMRRHLLAARVDLEECQWWRGNSVLFSLIALLSGENGEEEQAVDFLGRADELCIPLNKRYWLAFQLWVKGCLNRGALSDGPLSNALTEHAETYLKRAQDLYREMGVNYMVDRIERTLV